MAKLALTPAPPIKPGDPIGPKDWITDLLAQFVVWLSEAVAYVLNTLSAGLNTLVIKLSSTISSLLGALDDALEGIVLTLRAWTTTVTTLFNNILVSIQNAVTELFSALYNSTVAVIDKITTFVSKTADQVKALIQSVIDKTVGFFADAVKAIKDVALKIVEDLGVALAKLTDKIFAPIADVILRLKDAIKANEDAITAEWKRLVAASDSLLSETLADLADLATAFKVAMDGLSKTVDKGVAAIDKTTLDAIDRLVKLLFADQSPQAAGMINDFLHKSMSSPSTVQEFRNTISGAVALLGDSNWITRSVGTGLLLAVSAVPGYWNIGQAYGNIVLQELAINMPFNVLSPSDAIGAYRRTALDRGEAATNIRKGGFSERDANLMIDNSNIVPNPELVMAAWLREAIDDGVMEDALFQQGYSAGWRGVYAEMVRIIPPVQDLITMAVREAFTPDIAATFGQYDDFPEAFADWARKQGLSHEWAERYWAAHWSLPSAEQGFEMLHRGVIQPDELSKLLRALDVMPFWRDKLTQIAYYPYTRVDIRRMHKVGILDDAAVLKAHKDLGYDQEHAQNLTDFVIKLNSKKPAEDDAELGKLTRGTILGFYRDGLLARERAHQLLVTAGATSEGAELYLEDVDLDVERTNRGQEVTLAVDMFTAGILTFEEATDRLNQLGLATLEVKNATDKLVRASKAITKLPSLADGTKFFVKGLITKDDYTDLLRRLGYAAKWVAAYVKVAEEEVKNAAKSG